MPDPVRTKNGSIFVFLALFRDVNFYFEKRRNKRTIYSKNPMNSSEIKKKADEEFY